ncbi:trigger factor [soil metagenome]
MSTDTVTKTDSVTAPDAVTTKLPQTVEIKDVGPCKKHVKVTVDRTAIDTRFDEKISELVMSDSSHLDGFRPGKAPRKIIEKKYKKEVYADLKTEVLMASLEQLAEEQQISPLSPPELDPKAITIPEAGPFIYEFDIEVRPEFDIPPYKALKLKRPTHEFTDADVKKELRTFLEPYGQVVPKEGKDGNEPTVALDDIITADLDIKLDGKVLNTVKETRIKVEKTLALADGIANDFGKQLTGAKAGEQRSVNITLSQEIANPALKGKVVEAAFKVLDIKTTQPPELAASLLGYFGVRTEEQFEELMRVRLERKLEYAQRQTARTQVLGLLAGEAKWDLPQDLLQRQARKTLQRRVMEMRNAGMSDEQINGRARVLQNDALRSTADALKEHFVLQKIAEMEKLEIEDADIDTEIDEIAERTGETPRKVRTRLEKEDLIEAVATELLERKALDLVLKEATYEDYEMNPSDSEDSTVSTSSANVVSEANSEAPAEEPKEAEAKS